MKEIVEKFLCVESLRTQALHDEIEWAAVDAAVAVLVEELGHEQYSFFDLRVLGHLTAEGYAALVTDGFTYVTWCAIRDAMWKSPPFL